MLDALVEELGLVLARFDAGARALALGLLSGERNGPVVRRDGLSTQGLRDGCSRVEAIAHQLRPTSLVMLHVGACRGLNSARHRRKGQQRRRAARHRPSLPVRPSTRRKQRLLTLQHCRYHHGLLHGPVQLLELIPIAINRCALGAQIVAVRVMIR